MSWEEEDRKLVFAAIEELEDYLSSDQLQWRLSDSRGWLTPGNLLLSLGRSGCLDAQNLSIDFRSAVEAIQTIQYKRRAAWERKISAEMPYRLRLWVNSLDEFTDEGVIDPSFAAQVRNRVILEMLMEESRVVPAQVRQQLDEADKNLQKISIAGDFIWDRLLESGFNKEKYWFLYLRTNMVKI